MDSEVIMPLMGESVTEATLVKWLKKPGEAVKKDEPLLEVSTDKVDTEIPAPASGFLVKTLAEAGSTIAINTVIAIISEDAKSTGDLAKASRPAPSTPAPATAKGSVNEGPSVPRFEMPRAGGLRSSPLVRKMAREHRVDLTRLQGSGLHGRITKRDLLQMLATGGPQTSTAAPGGLERIPVDNVHGQESVEGVPVRREKMTKMRRLIAEHMVRTARVAPHVTTVFEIDLFNVVRIRETYQKEFLSREGFKLTFTPFFIHAAVETIKQFPIVNCSVDGDDVLYKDEINIGCAVALENGLIVPVIKNAQDLNLHGIAHRLNDLVTRARSKKLGADDVRGGTFSITNPGGFGSIVSTPLINQPQVAMLSIGAVVKRPVVLDDMIAIRPQAMIGLTFDHRVIDGEGGAKFLAKMKEFLENYSTLPL